VGGICGRQQQGKVRTAPMQHRPAGHMGRRTMAIPALLLQQAQLGSTRRWWKPNDGWAAPRLVKAQNRRTFAGTQ